MISKSWVQLELKFETEATKKSKSVRLRSGQFTVEAGLALIKQMKSPSPRLRLFSRGNITCVNCGVEGYMFYMEKNAADLVAEPHLTLYGKTKDGKEVMMTWDHIIPRSIGGGNSPANAQCMCTTCNENKGANLTIFEIAKIVSSPNALEMFKLVEPINFTQKVSGRVATTIQSEKQYCNTMFKLLKNKRKAMLATS